MAEAKKSGEFIVSSIKLSRKNAIGAEELMSLPLLCVRSGCLLLAHHYHACQCCVDDCHGFMPPLPWLMVFQLRSTGTAVSVRPQHHYDSDGSVTVSLHDHYVVPMYVIAW